MKLENEGKASSKATHWEKTLVENEYMVAAMLAHNDVYSNFTFALLEDSGWYLPSYRNTDPMVWGKNQGC